MMVLAGAAHCGPPSGRTWRRWCTVLLPAVQRGPVPQCPNTPHGRRGCPHCRSVRFPVSGRPRPVSASGQPVAAGHVSTWPRWPAQTSNHNLCAAVCWMGGYGSATVQPAGQPDTAAGAWVAAESDIADALAVRCCFRNRARCPDGWTVSGRLVSAADTSAACGVRGYRNRSPGQRPPAGCRHRRSARAIWRCSRSPSWART
jgi:hypothetical protein